MKKILALLLALLISSLALSATPKVTAKAAAVTVTANATLTWPAVTTSTTGTALSGVTYNIFDGNIAAGGTCVASSMSQIATGFTALSDSISLPGLTPGSIECFAVSASAGGQTGALSNIVPVTIPQPPAAVPGTTTITVTIVVVSSP